MPFGVDEDLEAIAFGIAEIGRYGVAMGYWTELSGLGRAPGGQSLADDDPGKIKPNMDIFGRGFHVVPCLQRQLVQADPLRAVRDRGGLPVPTFIRNGSPA